MAGERDLSYADRDRIMQHFAERTRVTRADDYPDLATAMLEAFEQSGRPLVFWRNEFRCYAPEKGYFAHLSELEVRDLALDLVGKKRGSATQLCGALKGRAYVKDGYFDLGRNVLTCADVAIVFDPADQQEPIKVEAHSPEFRALAAAPLPFLAGGANEREIEDFMCQAIPDEIARERLFELIGLALVGEGTRLHKFVILVGEGANGKSVMLSLFNGLLPASQVTSVTPQELTTDYGRAALRGSRLNTLPELDRIGSSELTMLKAIVSGDPVSARRVGDNGFTLFPQALQLIATNRLPQLGEPTMALKRRVVVIRFPNVVPEEQQDPFLLDRLRKLLPHLLRKCIEAANRALVREFKGEDRFPLSAQMRADADLLFGMDSISEFIDRRLEITTRSSDRLRSAEVYQAYEDFCRDQHVVAKPPTQLRTALARVNVTPRKSDGQSVLIGVRFSGMARGMSGAPGMGGGALG